MFAPLVASLMLVTALTRHAAPSALATSPIVCAPNADISQSGCGNGSGSAGASGFFNQDSPGASGSNNLRSAGASGFNHVDSPGASGCNNINSPGASGNGHVNSPGASGGPPCSAGPPNTPPPTTPPTTGPPTTGTTIPGETTVPGETTIGTAVGVVPVAGQTLPVTGKDSTGPLTLALGLMVSGAAAAGLANRRRHALAAVNGGELIPLSAAVGLLLTGRAKSVEPQDDARKS